MVGDLTVASPAQDVERNFRQGQTADSYSSLQM